MLQPCKLRCLRDNQPSGCFQCCPQACKLLPLLPECRLKVAPLTGRHQLALHACPLAAANPAVWECSHKAQQCCHSGCVTQWHNSHYTYQQAPRALGRHLTYFCMDGPAAPCPSAGLSGRLPGDATNGASDVLPTSCWHWIAASCCVASASLCDSSLLLRCSSATFASKCVLSAISRRLFACLSVSACTHTHTHTHGSTQGTRLSPASTPMLNSKHQPGAVMQALQLLNGCHEW